MAVKRAKLADLIPDAANANVGTERGLHMLDESLRQYGAGRSILVDKEGRIIAGNKTVERAADLGFDDVLVVETDGTQLVAVKRTDLDLNDGPAARQLAYMDNRVGQLDLDWNAEQMLADVEAGLDLGGMFHADELADILGDLRELPDDPGPQIDRAAELQEKWQAEREQVWEVGRHRVMCGDSTNAEDVVRLVAGEVPDSVIADPPYNIGKFKNEGRDIFVARLAIWLRDAKAITDGPVVFFPGPLHCGLYWQIDPPDCVMAWVKMNSQGQNPFLGTNKWEPLLVWRPVKDKGTDVIDCNVEYGERLTGDGMHISPKPTALLTSLVERFSTRSAYDPFLGSGTTLVACEQTDRIGYGMEIEPKYVAVTLERLAGMGLEPRLAA